MINANMRSYDYYTYGENDAYGQQTLTEEKQGSIKMSINIASQRVQENILYKGAEYIGLTHADIDDSYVIQFGDDRLKVLYVTPARLKQVFMARM